MLRAFFQRLEKLFCAVAFAEAGDHDTARRLVDAAQPAAPATLVAQAGARHA